MTGGERDSLRQGGGGKHPIAVAIDGIRPSLAREVRAGYGLPRIEAELSDRATRVFVARSAGHLVGYVTLEVDEKCDQAGKARQSGIRSLYVLRRFKRSGVGTGLLREAEEQARSDGSEVVWLTVWSGNADARRTQSGRSRIHPRNVFYPAWKVVSEWFRCHHRTSRRASCRYPCVRSLRRERPDVRPVRDRRSAPPDR